MSSDPHHAPPAQLFVTLVGVFGVMVVSALCSLGFAAATAAGEEFVEVATRPSFLAASALFQTSLLLLLGIGLSRGYQIRGRVRPTPRSLAIALMGGSVVGLLAGKLGGVLAQFVDATSLTLLTEQLLHAPWPSWSALMVAVVVLAPVAEELIFRGVVWDGLAPRLGGPTTLLLTTVLFSMYHLDPVHAVALLPTSLYFGWLRLRSGSVVPSIGAHASNNAASVALAMLAPELSPSFSWVLALLLAGLAFALLRGVDAPPIVDSKP